MVVADKDVGLGEIVVGEIEALGRTALLSKVDVRESEQVSEMVQGCMLKFGRVDILVNNAGGFFVAPVMEISEKGWDAVVRLNLKSTFLCSKAVAGIMMEKKKGVILNIASSSGEGPSPGSAHYGAAKAGVISLTQTLAVEWAPYVRVNAIAPGVIATPGTRFIWEDETRRARIESGVPLGRYGQPEDIAAAALYLVSDASDYVTGQVLDVNGGRRPTVESGPKERN